MFYKVSKLHKPSLERNIQRNINNVASFKSAQEIVKSLISVHRLKIYNSPRGGIKPTMRRNSSHWVICRVRYLLPHIQEKRPAYITT